MVSALRIEALFELFLSRLGVIKKRVPKAWSDGGGERPNYFD